MVTISEIRNKDIISQVDDVMVKVCCHCDVMWHLSLNGSLVPYLVPFIMRERHSHSLSSPLSHTHTLSLSHTHTLSLSHTHTHSLSHTLLWRRSIGRRTPRNGTRKENIFFRQLGPRSEVAEDRAKILFSFLLAPKEKNRSQTKMDSSDDKSS